MSSTSRTPEPTGIEVADSDLRARFGKGDIRDRINKNKQVRRYNHQPTALMRGLRTSINRKSLISIEKALEREGASKFGV